MSLGDLEDYPLISLGKDTKSHEFYSSLFQNLWSVWIPAVLINATASVLTSMLLFHVVETVTGEKRAKGVSVSAIFSAVIMVGLFMGSAMLSSAVALLQPAGDSVFAAGLARLVSAIVQWAVLTGILAAASRRPLATGLPTEMPSAQKPSGEDDASAAPPPGRSRCSSAAYCHRS